MASSSVVCPKNCSAAVVGSATAQFSNQNQEKQINKISFQWPNRKQSPLWSMRTQLSQVTAASSSNSAPILESKSIVASSEAKDESAQKVSGENAIPDAASISAFMTQVSDLVKLVDSKDIMELQLKQLSCEVIIRKKEALQPAAPVVMMQSPMPHAMYSSPPPPSPVAPLASPPASSSPASPPALPTPVTAPKSSHPALKCPMAGTFYRCPGPGEPPFVKVGDKVQKGQVVCIIEAMKLMNEIEADQSGTITEILVEDAKPVSVDMPLFTIAP